jgi:hypothetical protein
MLRTVNQITLSILINTGESSHINAFKNINIYEGFEMGFPFTETFNGDHLEMRKIINAYITHHGLKY